MAKTDDGDKLHQGRAALALMALGVVFGDIGTSPLYALRECFLGPSPLDINRDSVLGVLSLIFWSLMLIISVKYLLCVLRFDNKGEGGILALMSLAHRPTHGRKRTGWILILGVLGASLLFGDATITPAISVLSAVEGISHAQPHLSTLVVPITLVVLVVLFLIQRHGTARIGSAFGPVMVLWFAMIGILGLAGIVHHLEVLKALNPFWAVRFFLHDGWRAFVVLGSVFLAVTGGEALYADLGHFGRQAIQRAWFLLAMPCLVLNYFGQGGVLLESGAEAENLFYRLVPNVMLYPVIAVSTAATIIASQAVITGAFSLAHQAVQLGLLPRMQILHTSARIIGQIYVPVVNWALLAVVVSLVLGFKESGGLAGAYGLAVSGTMLITTILVAEVALAKIRSRMRPLVWLLLVVMLSIDSTFFAANVLKIPHGGWVALMLGALTSATMYIWWWGRRRLWQHVKKAQLPLELFVHDMELQNITRVPRTAVFLSASTTAVPQALLHNFKHNQILHERCVMLAIRTLDVPTVPKEERAKLVPHGRGIFALTLNYGFMQAPDVPTALRELDSDELKFDPDTTTYFLGKESLLVKPSWWLSNLLKSCFILLSRNAQDPSRFFKLPPSRVVELGAQVEL